MKSLYKFKISRVLSSILFFLFVFTMTQEQKALSFSNLTSTLSKEGKNNFIIAKAKKKRKSLRKSSGKKSRKSRLSGKRSRESRLSSRSRFRKGRTRLNKKNQRQRRKNTRWVKKRKAGQFRREERRRRNVSSMTHDLRELKGLMGQKKFLQASKKAFSMLSSSKYSSLKPRIRYLLGETFYKMNLHQAAAFQFTNIIKSGNRKLLKKSLKYLYLCASKMEDHTLLHYALSKISLRDFPKSQRDILYFRLGEIYRENKNLRKAIQSFSKVPSGSSFYYKSQYLKALSFAEMKENSKALRIFNRLIDSRAFVKRNDIVRVSALIGRARVLYQSRKWDAATQAYKEVPKDSEIWHNSLPESSWAFLRNSKFRSALSPLLSLHSSFYENFYFPESLLLRSMIYLYICKYEEIDKTLGLFQKIYRSLQEEINTYLNDVTNPLLYFNDTVKALEETRQDSLLSIKYPISPLLANKISRNGIFHKNYEYVKNLLNEKNKIETMPYHWRNSYIGKYTKKIIKKRLNKARVHSGKKIKRIMESINIELLKLFEQEKLIRYEVINSQRSILKEKIVSRRQDSQIDSKSKRSFYIQSGFEYWSFKGEFWLDEIGNYYYLGKSSCKI